MEKVFLDCDIALDLLARREPFYPYAAELFTLIETGKVKGYASPLMFANLYFILKQQKNREETLAGLKKLKLLLNVAPIAEKTIEMALASNFTDFEDAIQYYAALEARIKTIITRNKDHYRKAEASVYTAEEYLKLRAISKR